MFRKGIVISCLLFSGWLLNACSSGDSVPGDQAFIRGKINFPDRNVVYFCSYANEVDRAIGQKTTLDSAITDAEGNYLLKTHWTKPDLFDLKNGSKDLVSNFFICPGDEVVLNFPDKQQHVKISGAGKSVSYCKFINALVDTFYNEPQTHHQYYIESNYYTPVYYGTFCDDRRSRKMEMFNHSFKEYEISSDFKNLMVSEITYQSAVDRLMFSWKKRMKGEDNVIDSSYYDFLSPSLVENQQALKSPSYLRFLNLYIKDKYERLLETRKLGSDKSEPINAAVEKSRIAINELSLPFRNVPLFNIIHDDMISTGDKKGINTFSKTPGDSLLARFFRKYPSISSEKMNADQVR